MLAFLAIPVLLLVAVALAILARLRPDFRFYWALAAGVSLVAWLLLLAAGLQLPAEFTLWEWQTTPTLILSVALRLDAVSYPFAASLGSVILAAFLTALARPLPPNPLPWAGGMALTAVSLLAVFGANPLTMLLAWVALDATETLVLLGQVPASADRERVVISFAVRAGGVFLVLWAVIAAQQRSLLFQFSDLPQPASLYLLLAAGARLGVLPLYVTYFHTPRLRRGLGTIMRLVTAVTSLVLLARTAESGAPPEWQPLLTWAVSVVALLGAIAWAIGQDEMEGRPFWLLGGASLAMVAAVIHQPAASLSLGLVSVFLAAQFSFASSRQRPAQVLLLLSLVLSIGLPFTPGWASAGLFAGGFAAWQIVAVAALALLWFGFARHALAPGIPLDSTAPLARLAIPFGSGVLLLTHLGVGLWTALRLQFASEWLLQLALLLVALALAGLVVFLFQCGVRLPTQTIQRFRQFLSFDWIYRLFWIFYRGVVRLVQLLDAILEGEGGVLWTILLLLVLLSILAPLTAGGLFSGT